MAHTPATYRHRPFEVLLLKLGKEEDFFCKHVILPKKMAGQREVEKAPGLLTSDDSCTSVHSISSISASLALEGLCGFAMHYGACAFFWGMKLNIGFPHSHDETKNLTRQFVILYHKNKSNFEGLK